MSAHGCIETNVFVFLKQKTDIFALMIIKKGLI